MIDTLLNVKDNDKAACVPKWFQENLQEGNSVLCSKKNLR